jgi:hypothetical protein
MRLNNKFIFLDIKTVYISGAPCDGLIYVANLTVWTRRTIGSSQLIIFSTNHVEKKYTMLRRLMKN